MKFSADHEERAPNPALCVEVFSRLLNETRGVSEKALARLRKLGDQLPDGMVEQVEQLHDDPSQDRRKAVRVPDEAVPVSLEVAEVSGAADGAVMKDHCPAGLAVRLPCPAGVGTVLHVRMPPELGGDGWVTVEVKHCRREGDGWLAGCEIQGKQSDGADEL
jgi:hypothetical protein